MKRGSGFDRNGNAPETYSRVAGNANFSLRDAPGAFTHAVRSAVASLIPALHLDPLSSSNPTMSPGIERAVQPVMLVEDGIVLRPARAADFADWVRVREASRDHLTTWEPDWSPEEVTRKAFIRRIKADERQMRAGRRFAFLIVCENDGTLLGGISLSDIRLGNRRSGSVGYWVAQNAVRKGVATRAMRAILFHAFTTLMLNRVEAACQPGNVASRNLLKSSGFVREGLARNYLRINGAWRDHEIWARTHGR